MTPSYGSLDLADGAPSRRGLGNDLADDAQQYPTSPSVSVLDQRTGGRTCSKRAHTLFLLMAALATLLMISHKIMFTTLYSSASTSTNKSPAITMMMVRRSNNENGKKKDHQCIFTNVHCDQQQEECYIKPSEYQACLQHIQLDKEHVLQTIKSLDDIFAQHYPFYYLARSPNRTQPMIPSQELLNKQQHNKKFRIYDREYDLHAQLQSLRADVLLASDKASIATFWNVTAAFNWLRDAHVRAVQGTIGQLDSDFWSGLYEMVVFPSAVLRRMNAHSHHHRHNLLQTDFYYHRDNNDTSNGAAVLGLNLWRYSCSKDTGNAQFDGNIDNLRIYDRQQVTRVDGLSPWDFVLQLANEAPLASITFKSVGPRVNSLLFRNFATSRPAKTFFRTRPGRKERIWPSDIMPNDSFHIEYKGRDGKRGREEFDSRIVITPTDFSGVNDLLLRETATSPSGNRLVVDITDIEKAANVPSCLYRNYMNGMKEAGEAAAHAKPLVRPRNLADTATRSVIVNTGANREIASKDDSKDFLDKYCSCSEDGWYTKHYNCSGFAPPFDDDGPFEAGFKVLDDAYVVLWIDSFDAPPGLIFPLWSEITKAARNAGVDKLMIDISNNGGGEVPMGLNLARLLYPEVACEFFDNAYDMVYNQAMRVWATDVDPLLRQIESELLSGDVVLDNEMLKALDKATAKQRQDMVHKAEAMCIFALDHKV